MTTNTQYLRSKRHRIRRDRYGTLWIDATPYRARILAWREQGWSYPAIATATGLGVDTIQRIAGNIVDKTSKWVFRETIAKLDRPDWTAVTGSMMVPALGARRRLQALSRIGWTHAQITAEAGLSRGTVNATLYRSAQCTADTRNAICAAYDRLSHLPQTGPTADRIRLHATRNGWAAPLAWDNIDDPCEKPAATRHTPRVRTFQQILDIADAGHRLPEIMRRTTLQSNSVYNSLLRHQRLDVWTQITRGDTRDRAA